MGCNSSLESSGWERKQEEEGTLQYSHATIRSGASARSPLSSHESGVNLSGSLGFDLEIESSTESSGSGNHGQDQRAEIGINLSTTPTFTENIPLGELTELTPLAGGGFCVICSCSFRGLQAVLKIPRLQSSERAVDDLLAEIHVYRLISALGGHPNIAKAFGAGFHPQQGRQVPFLLLERLQGGTLTQILDINHPLRSSWESPVHRLQMALHIAEGICFLHNNVVSGGFILHRDLKPANIGLSHDGRLKVFDLGLSKVQPVRQGRNDRYMMSGMAGSKRFMAPEVYQGMPYNEKVDVYSFGIILWEICALRKPFAGMSVEDHFQDVIIGGQRPPLNPAWPDVVRHLLRLCWHVEPDCRPSITEVRDWLRAFLVSVGANAT